MQILSLLYKDFIVTKFVCRGIFIRKVRCKICQIKSPLCWLGRTWQPAGNWQWRWHARTRCIHSAVTTRAWIRGRWRHGALWRTRRIPNSDIRQASSCSPVKRDDVLWGSLKYYLPPLITSHKHLSVSRISNTALQKSSATYFIKWARNHRNGSNRSRKSDLGGEKSLNNTKNKKKKQQTTTWLELRQLRFRYVNNLPMISYFNSLSLAGYLTRISCSPVPIQLQLNCFACKILKFIHPFFTAKQCSPFLLWVSLFKSFQFVTWFFSSLRNTLVYNPCIIV